MSECSFGLPSVVEEEDEELDNNSDDDESSVYFVSQICDGYQVTSTHPADNQCGNCLKQSDHRFNSSYISSDQNSFISSGQFSGSTNRHVSTKKIPVSNISENKSSYEQHSTDWRNYTSASISRQRLASNGRNPTSSDRHLNGGVQLVSGGAEGLRNMDNEDVWVERKHGVAAGINNNNLNIHERSASRGERPVEAEAVAGQRTVPDGMSLKRPVRDGVKVDPVESGVGRGVTYTTRMAASSELKIAKNTTNISYKRASEQDADEQRHLQEKQHQPPQQKPLQQQQKQQQQQQQMLQQQQQQHQQGHQQQQLQKQHGPKHALQSRKQQQSMPEKMRGSGPGTPQLTRAEYKRIYTDWANHYLERSHHPARVTDLQAQLKDGTILAAIIESIALEKIPGLNDRPSTASEMVDNINRSLDFLSNLGVRLDHITAQDIHGGNLRTILSLFYGLSRFKQNQRFVPSTLIVVGVTNSAEVSSLPVMTSSIVNRQDSINRSPTNQYLSLVNANTLEEFSQPTMSENVLSNSTADNQRYRRSNTQQSNNSNSAGHHFISNINDQCNNSIGRITNTATSRTETRAAEDHQPRQNTSSGEDHQPLHNTSTGGGRGALLSNGRGKKSADNNSSVAAPCSPSESQKGRRGTTARNCDESVWTSSIPTPSSPSPRPQLSPLPLTPLSPYQSATSSAASSDRSSVPAPPTSTTVSSSSAGNGSGSKTPAQSVSAVTSTQAAVSIAAHGGRNRAACMLDKLKLFNSSSSKAKAAKTAAATAAAAAAAASAAAADVNHTQDRGVVCGSESSLANDRGQPRGAVQSEKQAGRVATSSGNNASSSSDDRNNRQAFVSDDRGGRGRGTCRSSSSSTPSRTPSATNVSIVAGGGTETVNSLGGAGQQRNKGGNPLAPPPPRRQTTPTPTSLQSKSVGKVEAGGAGGKLGRACSDQTAVSPTSCAPINSVSNLNSLCSPTPVGAVVSISQSRGQAGAKASRIGIAVSSGRSTPKTEARYSPAPTAAPVQNIKSSTTNQDNGIRASVTNQLRSSSASTREPSNGIPLPIGAGNMSSTATRQAPSGGNGGSAPPSSRRPATAGGGGGQAEEGASRNMSRSNSRSQINVAAGGSVPTRGGIPPSTPRRDTSTVTSSAGGVLSRNGPQQVASPTEPAPFAPAMTSHSPTSCSTARLAQDKSTRYLNDRVSSFKPESVMAATTSSVVDQRTEYNSSNPADGGRTRTAQQKQLQQQMIAGQQVPADTNSKPKKIDSNTQTSASAMQSISGKRQSSSSRGNVSQQNQNEVMSPGQFHQGIVPGESSPCELSMDMRHRAPSGRDSRTGVNQGVSSGGRAKSAGTRGSPLPHLLDGGGRDQSSSSLNSYGSTATTTSSQDKSSSNSNNSGSSSTDSVVFRPSVGADEANLDNSDPSGRRRQARQSNKPADTTILLAAQQNESQPPSAPERQTNDCPSSNQPLTSAPSGRTRDHIASLRSKKHEEQLQQMQQQLQQQQQQQQQQLRQQPTGSANHRSSPNNYDLKTNTTGLQSKLAQQNLPNSSSLPRHGTADITPSCKQSNMASLDSGKERCHDDAGVYGEDSMSQFDSIKPMMPIMRASPYAYLRSIPPLSLSSRPSVHVSGTSSSPAGASSSRLRPTIDPSSSPYYQSPGRRVGGGYGGGAGGGRGGGGRGLNQDGGASGSEMSSDAEGFDVTAGYMSDGDILRSHHLDDVNCGYMSESGVSVYVKRMQQRFREGMLAVKECMERSNNLVDDDSADDASSISSGEISDAINDMSTDDNITTGSSLSATSSELTSDNRATGNNRPLYNPTQLRPMPNVLVCGTALASRGLRMRGTAGEGGVFGMGGRHQQTDSSNSVENWQKYMIRDLTSGASGLRGAQGGFERGAAERSTLPLTGGSGNGVLYHPGCPSAALTGSGAGAGGYGGAGGGGAIFVKQSHRAIITDLKNRSSAALLSGTAVAIDHDPNESGSGDAILVAGLPPSGSGAGGGGGGAGGGGGKQKRDSDANTDSRRTSNGQETDSQSQQRQRSKGASLSDCESLKSSRLANSLSQRGSSLRPQQPGSGPYSAASLERTAAMTAALRVQEAGRGSDEYDGGQRSGSLDRNNMRTGGGESPMDGMIGGGGVVPKSFSSRMHAADLVRRAAASAASRGGSFHNYANIDGTGHIIVDGPGARPLSDGQTDGAGENSTTGSSKLNQRKGAGNGNWTGLRMAMSETDSIEDLTFSPYGIRRGSRNQPDAYGLNARALQQHDDEMNRHGGTFGGRNQTSMSPGGTLNRPESNSQPGNGVHGSSLSLISTNSSVYSTAEEKQAQEIRKLRRELEAANEKVYTLTTQLNTNAHVVAAFEQSLSNMTHRLQKLTATSQQKDSELNDLRQTIESIKGGVHGQLSTPGGTRDSTGSSTAGASSNGTGSSNCSSPGIMADTRQINRHVSVDSVTSLHSFSSAYAAASNPNGPTGAGLSSGVEGDKKKVKKSWLRSSFTKAFSRKRGVRNGSLSDVEPDTASLRSDSSMPNSPMIHLSHTTMSMPSTPLRGGGNHLSVMSTKSDGGRGEEEAVYQLKQELHEKDLKLTDIQLDALSSAHQLEQMCESMNRLKSEMLSLKSDNDRLQKIISEKDLDSCFSGLSRRSAAGFSDEVICVTDYDALDDAPMDNGTVDGSERKGKRALLHVRLTSSSDVSGETEEAKFLDVLIGAVNITTSTKWDALDATIRRAFKEYVLRMESGNGSMGLTTDSIAAYQVGTITRSKPTKPPADISPAECLPEENAEITVTLKGTAENAVDALCFETLVPKSILQRYTALVLEHRRLILCGPSGTGKTYLAQKLAEYVVRLSGNVSAGAIATFNVDHKSGKELRQYLANIADQCGEGSAASVVELPSIIILDNLHHAGSLAEVFNGFLATKHQHCPYIIGTMNQPSAGGGGGAGGNASSSSCSSASSTATTTANLQLHHNFRWILCANHMEPTRGFLSRYLRRRLIEYEIRCAARKLTPSERRHNGQEGVTTPSQGSTADLRRIVEWLPKVWQHINRFIEIHSSSDVTIGPRLFLSCPMDVADAQVWFTDLWNYSVVPYLIEAAKEGLQTYGHRATTWEDPVDWVVSSYPWNRADRMALLHIRHEDVGYDPSSQQALGLELNSGSLTRQHQAAVNCQAESTETKDPLINMLLRLQEAANYSGSIRGTVNDNDAVSSRTDGRHGSPATTSERKSSSTTTSDAETPRK